MNDKDKEAFEKWFKDAWDIDFDGYDFRHKMQVKAWQAACEHERARSQKLVEALELIALDNIFIAENGWRDEYFLSVKQAKEALAEYKKEGEE